MPHYFTIPKLIARGQAHFSFGQTEMPFAQNEWMQKGDIRQIFIRNLEEARKMRGLTKQELARRAGMSNGHLSEVINGISDITLRRLADLAHALQVLPMELLADSETARNVALARIAWGKGVPDQEVERHLPFPPPAPAKEAAPRAKKARPRRDGRNAPPTEPLQ